MSVFSGKHIFEHVIGPNGILRNKTRILVTHGIGFLPQTDNIFVVSNNTVSETGSYNQLLHNNGEFAKFLRTYLTEEAESDEDEKDPETSSLKEKILEQIGEPAVENHTENRRDSKVSRASLKRVRSVLRESSRVSRDKKEKELNEKEKPVVKVEDGKGKLVDSERMEVGVVKWSVYITFMKQLSWQISLMILIFYGSYSALGAGAQFWLSAWSRDSKGKKSTDVWLGAYGGFGIAQCK